MINRGLKKVTVRTFDSSIDAYGQKRQGLFSDRVVEMDCKVYAQSKTDDIRYVEVTDVGLTKDKDITDENQVITDGVTYEVLYVLPTLHYNQVLMRRI